MKRFMKELTGKLWLKRLVNSTGKILQKNAPFVYTEAFLPLKIYAKKMMLVGFKGKTQFHGGKAVNLWKFAPTKGVNSNPLVSIIVPCYNHAAYLRERLDSVYGQSYQNFEVLLLDDASTDGSQAILREYQERYGDKTSLYFNEKNQGNVFSQWQKGLAAAQGDVVWIAESDDYCDKDFLAKLLPAFRDNSVMLAFCRSEFVQNGNVVNTSEYYLKDMTAFDWNRSFYVTANCLVEQAFSVLNIIPNVSSVLFRRPLGLSDELRSLWRDMKLCGDWAFYLDIIKGGCVYYSHDTTNYYRVHENSTSLSIQKQTRYYCEHENIARYLERNYRLPDSVHKQHLQLLKNHYLTFFPHAEQREVETYFDLSRISEEKKLQKPNVLMAIFSMSIGGGEVFPIVLANELKRLGVPVTVLDFQMGEDMPGVHKMLRSDIPYIPQNNIDSLNVLIHQLGTDVIHSHHGTVDEAVSYAMQDMPPTVHHVITLHGMYETKEPPYQESIIRQVYPTCDCFVYIAEKNLEPFAKLGLRAEDKFRKIGNGLPYAEGHPIPRAELSIPEDAFVLCLVSRAIPEKGWQVAADAVIEANKRTEREVHLLLVGSGEMYERMKGNAPSYVHLLGFRPNVRDYFATADAGLLPSEFTGESYPLVLIECLYCNRPMIATDVGEVRRQLQTPQGDLAGVLLSLTDGHIAVEELTDIICRLASDNKQYNSLKSRCPAAAEKFYIENVAKNYIAVYENVTTN